MTFHGMMLWIATAGGFLGDVGLCWLSWHFLLRPKLIRFIDSRIDVHSRINGRLRRAP